MAGLLGSIALGVFLGWKKLLPLRILVNSSKIITISIIILLVTMGFKIGMDKQTLSNLGKYGLQALVFAVATIAFSLGSVAFLEKLFTAKSDVESAENIEVLTERQAHPYKMTLIIVTAFVVGILIGFTVIPAEFTAYLPYLTNIALHFTVLAVGIDLGQNKEMWKQFLRAGRLVFIAPLGVAAGSILAGMICGKVLGWKLLEGGAVGAGFGWYSLSGVIISEMHSVALGTIAFLSNIMREILAIIIIPILAGRTGKLALIAPGGATTMDTTLPIIAAAGPPGIAVFAFINGVILSAFVPILVTFLLSF